MISVIKNLFSKNKQDVNLIKNKKWTLSPIKVYIAPIKLPSYVANESMYRNMIIQAFNTWSIASGGKLKFEMTDHLLNSSINIVWKKVDGHDLGHCSFNWDSRGILYGAEISIGLFATRIAGIDYDTEIYHSILHCVGIALGVPQTNNPDDIMCIPHQRGKIELSENDRQAVYNLYNPVEDNLTEPEMSGESLGLETQVAHTEPSPNIKKCSNIALAVVMILILLVWLYAVMS